MNTKGLHIAVLIKVRGPTEVRSDQDRPMPKFRPKFVRTAGEPPPLFSGVLQPLAIRWLVFEMCLFSKTSHRIASGCNLERNLSPHRGVNERQFADELLRGSRGWKPCPHGRWTRRFCQANKRDCHMQESACLSHPLIPQIRLCISTRPILAAPAKRAEAVPRQTEGLRQKVALRAALATQGRTLSRPYGE